MTNINQILIDNIAGVSEINDEVASVCSGGNITLFDEASGDRSRAQYANLRFISRPGDSYDLANWDAINPARSINRKASRIEITEGVYLVRTDDPNNAYLLSPGTHVLNDPGFSGFDNAITSVVRVV